MKTIISIATLIAAPFFVNAQSIDAPPIDSEVFKIGVSIFVMGILMIFVLGLLKRIMDYSLKNKIIENEVPENIASVILQTNPKEDRNSNIKWFAIMMGLGLGLAIVDITLPLGIHSLAIMAFCMAGSFLAYFFFLKQSKH
jgi:hypothetical protein